MSKGVNKVILVGNVGQDPEVRYLPNGGAVANVSIATSEIWTDKNSGQRQEKTEWHRVVFFGKLADVVSQYVKKGSKLYAEGKLQTRKWQDQSGQDRYTTEIVVDDFNGVMQMLDSRNDGGQQPQQSYQQPAQQCQQQQQTQQVPQQPAPGMNANGTQQSPMNGLPNNYQQPVPNGGDPFIDDIPFAQHMKRTFI